MIKYTYIESLDNVDMKVEGSGGEGKLFSLFKVSVFLPRGKMERERIMGYTNAKTQKTWVDDSIVSLLKTEERRKVISDLVKELTTKRDYYLPYEHNALYVIAEEFRRDGFVVKQEYIGGSPPDVLWTDPQEDIDKGTG